MFTSKLIALQTLLMVTTFSFIGNAMDGSEGPPKRVISLDQAHQMAATNNPSFKNMEETVSKADTVIGSAWAMLLPNVTAEGSIIRNKDKISMALPDFSAFDPSNPDAALPSEELVIQEKWGKGFGFSANMTLLNPRSFPLLKNAYASADRARLEARRHKNDLLFAVTSSYYQVRAMEEMAEVWKENIETAKEFHALGQARKDAGDSTEIDVLRAEIQVVEAKKGHANAIDAVRLAKSALGYLIGLEGDFNVESPGEIEQIEDELDGLKEQALRSRVDLKEAEITEEMASRAKSETLMKWLPTFDVTYSWNWNGAEGFAGEHDTWMIIFGAKWNIFEGGSRIAEAKSRDTDVRMVRNRYAQVSIDIRQEVEKAYVDMMGRMRDDDLLRKQFDLAKKNHELVKKQFEVGLATSLDLQNASSELAKTRNTQVIEHLELDIAKLRLLKAAGEYHTLSK